MKAVFETRFAKVGESTTHYQSVKINSAPQACRWAEECLGGYFSVSDPLQRCRTTTQGDLPMSQTIRIKTVVAPKFKEAWNMLTPRLHLVVSYTKGGTSYLTGRNIPRGYEVAIQHDRLSEGGVVTVLLDARCGNPTASLEPAARFSAKTLDRIVADVRNGKHDVTIAELYEKAKANRSEFAWPASILPLAELTPIPSDGFSDGGCAYTDEELATS